GALAAGAPAPARARVTPRPPGLARARSPRADAAPRSWPHIAILCYHHLSDDPNAKLEMVPPGFLRRQIRACRRSGWTFLSLSQLLERRQHPGSLPPKTLVLTFDDG